MTADEPPTDGCKHMWVVVDKAEDWTLVQCYHCEIPGVQEASDMPVKFIRTLRRGVDY